MIYFKPLEKKPYYTPLLTPSILFSVKLWHIRSSAQFNENGVMLF